MELKKDTENRRKPAPQLRIWDPGSGRDLGSGIPGGSGMGTCGDPASGILGSSRATLGAFFFENVHSGIDFKTFTALPVPGYTAGQLGRIRDPGCQDLGSGSGSCRTSRIWHPGSQDPGSERHKIAWRRARALPAPALPALPRLWHFLKMFENMTTLLTFLGILLYRY